MEVEAGTGQEDMVLCYLGILHNYHNSHHTSVLALEEWARSLAGCLQRRVVEGVVEELLEVLVLEAQEGMQEQQQEEEEEQSPQQEAPVLEVDTGHERVVLHSPEQKEHYFVPAVQPENLMS